MSDLQCPICDEILITVKQITADMERAFPDGAESHGKYHAEVMEAAKAQTKFWVDLSLDLKAKGIKSLIFVLIGYTVVKLFGSETAKSLLKFIM